MPTYLAIEHGDIFRFDADDKDDAKDGASMWGAELLGEIPKDKEHLPNRQLLAHVT